MSQAEIESLREEETHKYKSYIRPVSNKDRKYNSGYSGGYSGGYSSSYRGGGGGGGGGGYKKKRYGDHDFNRRRFFAGMKSRRSYGYDYFGKDKAKMARFSKYNGYAGKRYEEFRYYGDYVDPK